jgi:predicted amidohydrolase YtcJ
MHASWGAKMSFDEEERGALHEGKVADFVILDKNPLRVPLESIKDIEIEALYLGGRKYTGQEKSATKLLARCAGNKIKSLFN